MDRRTSLFRQFFSFRSTSLLRLILFSFLVVILPLISALIAALVAMDHLTQQGRKAVFEATYANQASQALVEQLTAMERNARQFQILKDQTLYKVYQERHRQFRRTAQELRQHQLNTSQREQLDSLIEQEQQVFQSLRNTSPDSEKVRQALEEFPALNKLARSILAESRRLIGREVKKIQAAADTAQRQLLWQASALIPVTFLLAAIFTVLITKPIRQIDQAIRRLGAGQFLENIEVAGPRDLEKLGERLDWLRRRLIELERQKVTVLRHMSHDLKTPLSAIREGIGLLSDQIVGLLNSEQAEIVQIMHKNTLQLQQLIEDLLGFSRIQTATPFLNKRPIPLHQLLKTSAGQQKFIATAKHLTFELSLEDITIPGDEDKLKTVFDNLLSNAIKYSPSRGCISIGLRQENSYAVVDFHDQGPGIDPNEQEKIFEAFYQGQHQSSAEPQGSGLGLSIAREYVHAHRGELEAVATAQGTHMRIFLPMEEPSSP